jgi:hypothetical protein
MSPTKAIVMFELEVTGAGSGVAVATATGVEVAGVGSGFTICLGAQPAIRRPEARRNGSFFVSNIGRLTLIENVFHSTSSSQESLVNQPNKKALVIVSLIVIGVMVLALVTTLRSDIPKLMDIFEHLAIEQLIFALVATGIAYLSFTLSFNALFEMTPYRVPFPKFFSIMFISYTINFIVSSGGVSGIAIRSFLLRHEKIPYSVTIPLSFAQNLVFNLVLSCVCFGGLIYLHGHPEFMSGPKQMLILVFMVGLLLVVTTMVFIFFNSAFRRWFLQRLLGIGHWIDHKVLRKKKDSHKWIKIHSELETTIKLLHKGWVQLAVVFFWVSMDWCFTALALNFCFHAVGVHLPLGLLMVGFTVMFLTSNINPVPAGLGVSESVLAVVFGLLGVGFEKTLVAALLFRFVFFLIPLAVSTALYLDTMRSFLKNEERIEAEQDKSFSEP